jgi:hypothetical protein
MDILIGCHCKIPVVIDVSDKNTVHLDFHSRIHILDDDKLVLLSSDVYDKYNVKSLSFIETAKGCINKSAYESFNYNENANDYDEKYNEYIKKNKYASRVSYYTGQFKETQYNEWDKIPKNSIDIIYPFSCIWIEYQEPIKKIINSMAFKSFLIDGWSILKNNGKIYIPLTHSSRDVKEEDILKYVNDVILAYIETNYPEIRWKIKYLDFDSLPYKLIANDETNIYIDNKYKKDKYIEFSKEIAEGGKRKYKKTRKGRKTLKKKNKSYKKK